MISIPTEDESKHRLPLGALLATLTPLVAAEESQESGVDQHRAVGQSACTLSSHCFFFFFFFFRSNEGGLNNKGNACSLYGQTLVVRDDSDERSNFWVR